jgi:hypothetical protein
LFKGAGLQQVFRGVYRSGISLGVDWVARVEDACFEEIGD